MAAPHVAGLAAYLAESYGYLSPSNIKAALNTALYTLPSLDPDGGPMKMPTVQP
jgi:subtilisin family serine protease